MSSIRRRFAVAAVALAAAATLPGLAQAQSASTASNTQSPPTPPIDTAAVGALNRMAAYLNTLLAMQVTGTVTTEKVLPDGQKLEFTSNVDVLAERPSRIRATVKDERKERLIVYNGNQATIWAPRMKYFTTFEAPSTLAALADTLENRFDMELPLVDLFRWGQQGSAFQNITNAIDVGPASIEGTTCRQYAFRQAGMDWQIWIQEGAFPLPRRLVITTMTDDARPQHTVTYNWNLAPSYNDGAFVFDPPDDAHEISIATVTTAALTGR